MKITNDKVASPEQKVIGSFKGMIVVCLVLALLSSIFLGVKMFGNLFGRKPIPQVESSDAQSVVEVDVAEAEQLIASGNVKVLDVRTPKEWEGGLIAADAMKLDFHGEGFEEGLTKLDRSQPWLVHCAAGVRSAKTRNKMTEMGFKKIYHFAGGSRGWQSAGKAFVE